jgi:protein involved in polysaccharide export with SLBB domain
VAVATRLHERWVKDMRYQVCKIGACVVSSLCFFACGRGTTRPVPLPPLEAAPEPGVSSEAAAGYRLQPGDLLRVKFPYHPELDIKVPIRPDGNITLQLAGEIHAAGLRTTELEQVIKERTSDRLRDPEISVMVAQLAEQRVYVGGEVRIPGFVSYHTGMSPLQAIFDRGGFTENARRDSVLRLSGAENDYQGTRLDFTKTLSEGTQEHMDLAAGDVLFVPRSFIGDVDSFVKRYVEGPVPFIRGLGVGGAAF